MSTLREAAQAVINRWYRLPGDNDRAILSDLFARLRAALAQPETEAGVSWDGHNVRGDAVGVAEVRRLIDFEQARQVAKPATGDDLRVYDAIAANYAHPPRDEWRPASVDCRTCRNLAKLDCLSTAMCIDGSQYKPTNPVQMWERTR